jgi:hypothetical protein
MLHPISIVEPKYGKIVRLQGTNNISHRIILLLQNSADLRHSFHRDDAFNSKVCLVRGLTNNGLSEQTITLRACKIGLKITH